MIALRQFSVSGYRAISRVLSLTDLGPYVALYGDNAVGKSALLQAVDLLGRLCACPPRELIGSGEPWPELVFYERFAQDRWMFNLDSGEQIQLAALTNEGLAVGFELRRLEDGIQVKLSRCERSGESLLTADPPNFAELQNALSPLRVRLNASPRNPVDPALRAAAFRLLASPDARIRARARGAFRSFGQFFPALGHGELDLLHRDHSEVPDLAWVNESAAIPLDRVGGGVQSVVSTLVNLLSADAPIVCMEEPEAFVGVLAMKDLANVFRTAAAKGVCGQVWIATHAIGLTASRDRIVMLSRDGGTVTCEQADHRKAGRFAQTISEAAADPFNRLGHDGSVIIPSAYVERLGLRPGDFVYFGTLPDGVRIMNGEQMDATLGDVEGE